jgi:ABC-2 type transport system permease protein
MKSILALAGKDIRLLVRDRVGFFFVFFFPLIYAVFFGVIFSGQSGGIMSLNIAVVDEDKSEASQRFIQKLADSTEFTVLLTHRQDAFDQVRRGDQLAYVLLPEGFSDARSNIFKGEPLLLEAGVDPSRKAEAGLIQGMLTQYAYQELQSLILDRKEMRRQIREAFESLRVSANNEMNPLERIALMAFLPALDAFLGALPGEDETGREEELVAGTAAAGQENKGLAATGQENKGLAATANWQPVKVTFKDVVREKVGEPKSSYDITFPQSIAWVLIGCSAAFGISLVVERTRGTLLRLRSAPITLTQILAGKALACFLTVIAASSVLFLFFHFIFGLVPDSFPLLVLGLASAALAFVGIMMLLSVMGKTEASAGGIGWAVLLLMAMTGGGMIPLFFMPSWLQFISNFSFIKWSILAMEGAVWRGFSLQEMLKPCGILLAIGGVSFFAGARLFKITVD